MNDAEPTPRPLESWRKVFREGFAPIMSDMALSALKDALERDDPSLIQGATSSPPPLDCVKDWQCEAACLVGICGWKGEGLETVGEVEDFFARACYDMDHRLGEPAACRWLLNWYDDTPRGEMRRELLSEVDQALTLRGARR